MKRNGVYLHITGIPEVFKVGNKKIGYDTLIYSMGKASDCPSHKLGLCKFINTPYGHRNGLPVCYAAKMEWSDSVRNYRERQAEYWKRNNSEDIAKHIAELARVNKIIKYVRINETSDMASIDDFIKWFEIAEQNYTLIFYTYTHRSDLLNQLNSADLPGNVVIQSSEQVLKGYNAFIAVPEYKFDKLSAKTRKCHGRCDSCNQCKVKHGQPIYVKLH
jgi:hypothetical protein